MARSRVLPVVLVVTSAALTSACGFGPLGDLADLAAPTTSTSSTFGTSGPSASTGSATNPLTLKVGTCLDATEDDETVQVIDCADEHEEEIYAVQTLPAGDYPGEESVWDTGDDLCLSTFDTFVGKPYEDSLVEYWAYTPYVEDWSAGLRTIVCSAYDLKRYTTTGTLKGSGR